MPPTPSKPQKPGLKMTTLRRSPAALHHSPPSPATTVTQISSSLRPLPFPLRRRFSSLKISLPSRRFACGGSAAGASMMYTPASIYASALADVANSNNALDATIDDMENIDTVFSYPSVQSFFANPTVSDERKLEFIKDIVASSSSKFQPHTVNFLNILVDTKRINLMKEIVKEFEACYNRLTGTEVALVSSVVKLQSQHLAQIAKTVQRLSGAKNVRIKTAIDPSLVAGFTIRYGNTGSKLIDMSVKRQLNEISSQLDFSSIALA